MIRPSLKTITGQWLDAFNRHDTDAILALYHDDAVHYSPRLRGQSGSDRYLRGKPALKALWEACFQDNPGLRYVLLETPLTDQGEVFLKYRRTADGQEPQDVLEYLKMEGGLIRESRVLSFLPSPKPAQE